jgi:flagellar biosynthesis anti-sigma factor FlgM
MADPISSVGGRSPQASRLTESEAKKGAQEVAGSKPDAGEKAAPGTDRVELSEALKAASSGELFDADRVAALRQAIADGQYPLDPKKIAESFASIERLI